MPTAAGHGLPGISRLKNLSDSVLKGLLCFFLHHFSQKQLDIFSVISHVFL